MPSCATRLDTRPTTCSSGWMPRLARSRPPSDGSGRRKLSLTALGTMTTLRAGTPRSMISSRIASPSVTTRSASVMQCVSSARVRT